MPAYYSILQFRNDEVANERINVGVVAYNAEAGPGEVLFHTVKNTQRLRCFSVLGADVTRLLRRMRDEITASAPADVQDAAKRWSKSFLLTQPKASLLPADETLLYCARRFLIDPPAEQPGHYRKNDVVKTAKASLRTALQIRFGGIGELLLKSRHRIPGSRTEHAFDITLGNGVPYAVFQAVSFQVDDDRNVEKEVNAAAFQISDVRAIDQSLPITVVVAPPTGEGARANRYREATGMLTELGAEVRTVTESLAMATERVTALPDIASSGDGQ